MTLPDLLKKSTIFKTLPDDAIDKLAGSLKIRSLQTGEILFSLGDVGDEMIFVEEGQIAIYMPDNNQPHAGQALRLFEPGDVLGEMALIDRLPRSTSARAQAQTKIAALDINTFKHLLEDYPEVAMDVMSGLSNRIRYTTAFIGEIRQGVQRMAEGNYQDIQAPNQVQDSSLSALAAEFVRMAAQVREREEKLQQEVAQLRIEIDEGKRRQEVSQITTSDYYISLKDKLKALREQDDDDKVNNPPDAAMHLIYEQIKEPEEQKAHASKPTSSTARQIYEKLEAPNKEENDK